MFVYIDSGSQLAFKYSKERGIDFYIILLYYYIKITAHLGNNDIVSQCEEA